MPKEGTGFRESLIWNKLYDFQKDAALAIINKLETYNGCILADSVGLGKTFTALAVVKYFEARNRNEQSNRRRPSALRCAVPYGSEPHAGRYDYEHPD